MNAAFATTLPTATAAYECGLTQLDTAVADYRSVCRCGRLQYVDAEVDSYAGRYDELYAKLWSVYGSNPLDEGSFVPPYPPVPSDSPLLQLINATLLQMTEKPKGITGRISSMVRGSGGVQKSDAGQRAAEAEAAAAAAAASAANAAVAVRKQPADAVVPAKAVDGEREATPDTAAAVVAAISGNSSSGAVSAASADSAGGKNIGEAVLGAGAAEAAEAVDSEELQQWIENEVATSDTEVHFTDAFRYW